MRTIITAPLVLLAVAVPALASVPMPKPHPGDQGTYTLLSEVRRPDGVIETIHHRAGPSGPTWSWNEVRCRTQESREMATSYDGPDSPKGPPTQWTRVTPGSSKAMLVRFVCVRKADGVPEIGKP